MKKFIDRIKENPQIMRLLAESSLDEEEIMTATESELSPTGKKSIN